ncbi:MAG: type III-B CRISPR module RAMP protein Cmr1, partial [Archaeoglobaceae archaeon]
MFEARFKLEAITPIFMRGADQTKAEIRAASIKGLMRWWFRALAGNYFGNDIDGLRRAEEYIFGSTNRRSRVVVEVEAPKPSMLHFKPGRIDRGTRVGELRYLWFSIQLLSQKGQFQYYYPPEEKFLLKIRSGSEKEF